MEPISPIGVFASSFGFSAFAGLAALLRSRSQVTLVTAFSALLNSGLLGLGISLIWYVKFQDNLFLLIGVCVLAGLGGMTMIDFVLHALKSGGINFNIGQRGEVELGREKVPSSKKKDKADVPLQ